MGVIIQKKSGELRMCVDYRKLNAKTAKASYRIPTIDEVIDTLEGAKRFDTLDYSSDYHQVLIEDAENRFHCLAIEILAVQSVLFGLCNAQVLFQRMMERVLSWIHLKTVLVYLDDIIMFGASVSDMKDRLDVAFEKIN